MSVTPSGGRSTGRASVPGSIAPSSHGSARVPTTPGTAYRGAGGPGGPGGPRDERRPAYRGGPRPRWGRIALVVLVAMALLAGVGFGGAWIYASRLNSGLSRTDAFSKIRGDRPAKTVDGALNILMLGSDSRDPDSKAQPGQWRTDTMILMHIPASHDHAYLISIPRDLYVYIPKSPTDASLGDTRAKINAAFAWGGVPLAVQTIEGFTGVRVDHVVLIDFGGFKEVTDALGGVDMTIEQDVKSIHKPFRVFHKGPQHLNGEEALDYCRQRYQFPDGDFARMRHQQQFLMALMNKATSTGTMTNPVKLNAFLKTLTHALTVDQDFSLIDMALQFRSIRGSDLTFLVSPNLGSQTINGESVVVSDKAKGSALYEAVTNDTVAAWVAQNVPPSPKPTG